MRTTLLHTPRKHKGHSHLHGTCVFNGIEEVSGSIPLGSTPENGPET